MSSVRTAGWELFSLSLALSGLALCHPVFGFQAAPAPPVPPPRPVSTGKAVQAPPLEPPTQGTGAIEGQIFNQATGAPLKKANVRLFGSRAQPGVMPTNLARETDEEGRFSFTSLPARKYQLSAMRQGFLNASYGARKLSGNGSPINLSQDQQMRGLVIKLSPQSVMVGKVLIPKPPGQEAMGQFQRCQHVGHR
jgi:hypothetical protein